MANEIITLNVNGESRVIASDPQTPLLYLLRNDLGLKGAKFACGLEQCGACKVLIDGEALPSCMVPVADVVGKKIETIESFNLGGPLHAVQQAFIDEQAVQCGVCTTGFIVSAKALLDEKPAPTDEDINKALGIHLCRCGVYPRVVRAVKRAAGMLSGPAIYEVKNAPGAEYAQSGQTSNSSLLRTPSLDSWIRINKNGTVDVFSGKVEYGQGLRTAIAQIAAEELDVSLDRVRVIDADTDFSPDEGMTVGSMSMQLSGNAVRFAAAEARHLMLSVAYEELEVPIDRLRVEDGKIFDPVTGRFTTYWDLFGGKKFGRDVTGLVSPKKADAYLEVGRPSTRIDLVPKVVGAPIYVHDFELPGMVHARVLRPPVYDAKLLSVDTESVAKMPGVLKVVQDGRFLAVIAKREEEAVRAMETLREKTDWEPEKIFLEQNQLMEDLQNSVQSSVLIVEGVGVDDPIPEMEIPKNAVKTLESIYFRPFQMHASVAPSAAVAYMQDGKLKVWVHTQGVYGPRANIAQVLRMPLEDVRVIHMEGAGCYGHNGADDAALDAALIAKAYPGVPVSLKWMREDEHRWEPYASAMVMECNASLDPQGKVAGWNYDVYSYPHLGRPAAQGNESSLIAAGHLENAFERPAPRFVKARHVGSHRNADPLYDFSDKRIVKHFVSDSPLRTSSLRGLGAFANVFAVESFIDELAHAAGIDPVAFRLKHLSDARAKAVIEAAAEKAGWGNPLPEGWGRGIGFARYKNAASYCAVIVDLRIAKNRGVIEMKRAVIAADSGQIINPDGLSNQLEGGLIQAVSWALKEEVRWGHGGIKSRDWASYPILRINESPVVETVLINRTGAPFLGSGEASSGPTPAAIGNAIFDAVGIRLRKLPFVLPSEGLDF